MTDLFSLKNKVAVITGATGLLGRQHCIALSHAGANIIVLDVSKYKSNKLASELETESVGIQADVTDKESLLHAQEIIISKFGRIDILVNNAAINDMFESPKSVLEQSKFENYPYEIWQKSFDVNVTGAFLCSQVFGSQMLKNKSGSIINVASTYGIVAPDQSLYIDKSGNQKFYKPPAYSATKGAILSFTKYLAAYWGREGIRVNALSPGGVENSQDDFFIEKYSSRTPLMRMAKPTDYKGALIFLASDASAYMTGANLIVDGGFTIW